MRLRDGQQVCPKCSGAGCYWCRRKGYRVQCPTCMNSEPELISKSEDDFVCYVCDARFEDTGKLVDVADPYKPKLVTGKPAKRTS